MAGLLDALAQQGLISQKETQVGNGLQRALESINGRTTTSVIPRNTDEYEDSYQRSVTEQSGYLQQQIDKQKQLNEQSGPLSYSNLTSTNPLTRGASNLLNFATNVAGAVVDQGTNLAGAVNISNANDLYSSIPDDIKELYQREKATENYAENNTSLQGLRNAIANGQTSSLVGYDKKYKTQSELNARIKELEALTAVKPLTEAERLRLTEDNPAVAFNAGLTSMRRSYKDVFDQIEQNYKDDRMWRGDRAKGIDNFFGSRGWGNDMNTEQFAQDFSARDKANADLNKQGQAQRANSDITSSDYWGGWGKSAKAFGGSLATAASALKDNPMALPDFVAETAPFLINRTAKVAMAGDAGRIYADASQDITERNGTAGLSNLEQAGVLANAGAYTGLNLIERSTLLGALGGRTPGAGSIERLSNGVTSAASRVGAKVADALPNAVVNTGRAINAVVPTGAIGTVLRNAGTAGALEGAVEIAQTQIEDSWSKLKTDIDTSNLAQAGVLGAAMGAGFSAPGSVLDYAGNKLSTQAEQQYEQELGSVDTATEDMLNPANPDYAPQKVVNRILASELPNQNYEGAKTQIDEIVTNINTQLAQLKETEAYMENPQLLQDRIDKGTAYLNEFVSTNTPETNPNYDAIVENVQGRIDALQNQYDMATSPEANIQEVKDSISRMQQALTEIETPYKTFNDAYTQWNNTNTAPAEQTAVNEQSDANTVGLNTDEAVASEVRQEIAPTEQPLQDANDTPETEARKHLGAPTPMNLGRIQELANNETIPEAVRSGLRVVANALLVANRSKSSDAVSKQVSKGDVGFRGTQQYLDEMSKALQSGDTGRQESLMHQMESFVQSRTSKLNAIQEAQIVADNTGKQIQVVKVDNGPWQVMADKALPRSQFEKNNGILVNPHRPDGTKGADALVDALGNDLQEITATQEALQAMRSIPADTFNGQVNDLRDGYMTQNQYAQPDYNPVQDAIDELNAQRRADREWNGNARSTIGEENVLPSTDGISTSDAGITNSEVGNTTPVEPIAENTQSVSNRSIQTGIANESLESNATPRDVKKNESVTGKTNADSGAGKADAKSVSTPVKFNYQQKFKSKEEATKYLAKHKKDNYFVVDSADGFAIKKNPTVDNQPTLNADAVTVIANETNTVNPESVQQNSIEEVPTEATAESNQVQSTSVPDAVVELEANTTQTVNTDISPDGSMSATNTDGKTYKETVAEERTKPWRLQNLIRSGFIQRIKDGFNSPLVTTQNYVSSVKDRSRKAIVETIVATTGKQPNEAQVILLNDFMNFNKARGVNKYIANMIKAEKNPEYNFAHFSDFLLDSDGKLDENTATAIALSIYSYIGENATALYADKIALGKILGIKNVQDVPPSVMNRISTIGTHQKTLASTLGQRAYQALQLKMLKDVDPSRQAKAEQMLGTLAIGAMIDLKLAERTRITNGELYAMAEYTEGKISTIDPSLLTNRDLEKLDKERLNSKAFTYFIRPATQKINGKLEPTNVNKRILDLHKGTNGLLPSMFGFTPYTTLPSLEPVTELPNTFNEFGGKLPDMVKEALLKQQSLAYKLNTPMVDLVGKLVQTNAGLQTVRDIMGYADPNDRHIAFEKAVNSSNIGIDRSLRLLFDTYDKVGDQNFYLPSLIWSNFRNGNPAGFNPQADKIHRAFVSLDNDLITVPLDNDLAMFDGNGELTKYGMFLRGLAFRMEDVKINGNAVDKTLLSEFIPQFHDYINSDEVRTAADSLNNLLTDQYSKADLDNVSTLLKGWEMSALGLSALMTINERNQAIKSGKTEFTTRLAADSDGLVNGPSITNVLMNSGSPDFYKSVGVIPFAKDYETQIESVQQMRKDPDARDPYEQLAEVQNEYWSQLPRDNTPVGNAVRALDYLDNNYGKRKGAKRALTPFNYGAGFDSVNRANARGTLEAIYLKIEKAGRDIKSNPNEVVNISKAINTLIKYYNTTNKQQVEYTTPDSIGNMDNLLTSKQELAIKQADIDLRGSATTSALTKLLAPYIKLRNGKVATANAAFDMYKAVHDAMTESAIKAKVESGDAFVVNGREIETLTAEERQQVLRDSYKYMPSLASPVGIKSKQALQSSIPLVNKGSYWNSEQEIEVKFNTGFGHLFTEESSNGPTKVNASTTLKTDIRESTFETPGVGSLALFIQSHDAFVTYSVMQAMQAQNFHDANSTNAYDLTKMAKVQNEAFLEAVTISHIGKAFNDATTKAITGFLENAHNIDAGTRISVLTSLRKALDKNNAPEGSFAEALASQYGDYYQSDIDKLVYLSQQHSIHQYATEGGGYILTDAKRKEILAKKEALEAESKQQIANARKLGAELDKYVSDLTYNTQPVTAEETIAQEASNTGDSFQRDLINNKEAFKDPVKLIQHVQKNLAKYLNSDGKQGRYAVTYNELLKLSEAVIKDSNLQVNIIDGSTDTSKVLGYEQAVADGMSAWFVSDKGKNQINLRLNTGEQINAKVITHEFIHAATSNAISVVRANPSQHVKAKESLDKLERLYEHVKSQVNDLHDRVIQYGVSNLDEFIATGLTYPKFMDFLDGITDIPKEARTKSTIGTAFRQMVSTVLDALYSVAGKGRKYSPKTLSAYEALVMDTAEFVTRNTNTDTTGRALKLFGAPRQKAINEVSEYTALEVFNSLDDGKLDKEFKAELANVITNVTDKLFTALPNKFARSKQDYSPDQIWNNALENGKAPFVTGAIKAGYNLSAQEQFAVEALEIALVEATKDGSVNLAYRTLAKSFDTARATLKVQDFHSGNWESASETDKKVAQAKYDYLFKVGKADYITRFTALALGSQEVNKMLDIKLERDLFATKDKPAFDKLINMANHIVNASADRMTRTIGTNTVQGKLPRLAQNLIELDLKNRNKSVNAVESKLLLAEDMADNAVNKLRNAGNNALLGSPLSMFNNKYANIVKNTLKATKDGRSINSVWDAVRDFRNFENPNERLGFLGELANEVGDQNKSQLLAEKLLAYAKQNESTAHRIRTVVKQDVLSHFENNGQDLSREQRADITTALLRTDAQSLLANYGYETVKDFMNNRDALNKAIYKLEKKINDPVKLSRTKSLAWYMVSGEGTETLGKNPTVIAQNAGLGFDLTTASDSHIKDIDDLASLYAIKYTPTKSLHSVRKIMDAEDKRKDGGGVLALVKYHESLARESYATLFQGNIVSYTKGYIPNITNPHKEVIVATNNADKDRLRSALYTEIGPVGKSVVDPDKQGAVMFFSEDAGSQRYISGAMALYNYGRKGTEIEFIGNEFGDAINKARASIDTSPDFDPRKVKGSKAIPTYDNNGNIIAFNYEMSGHVRDTYLERNNDFSDLVGEYTATGFSKSVLGDQNIQVADALIDNYKTEYKKDPRGFIFVGAGVSDPVLAQAWAMMPLEVRNHIYKRTGNNGLYVHNQAFLTIFGNKKYSVTSAFDKTYADQNIAEKLFTGFMRAMFRDNARVRTAQTERMWQDAVGLLKDIVIIRNMSTAFMNILSNSFLLLAHGVAPSDIVKHTIESVKAGGEYRKASAELIKLQNRQRIDVGNADEIQQSINMLSQRLERNPLKSFIDEGMFAGIVEDIVEDNQSYTYASGLQRKYEGVIDKVPKTVRNIAKYAFVSPGTPLYQFLHSATQYGDFSAKYVLYKHYTEKAKERLTHDQAITRASNNFINYDVPTSKGMQYANDMGIMMFTKYNLRIQRALFELLAKRPATAIGQAIILNAISNLPPGIDPLVFNQIGIPLRDGPLGLLGALDEPLPIKLLGNAF